MMFPQSRHSASSQQLKFTTSDSCDRIKDEFQFLQAQYHSYKEGGRHGVFISARDPLFVRVESLKPAFLPEEVGLFLCTCSPRTFQRLASAETGEGR
ncbi:amino-terminal enhancer of split isoform X1 [Lates japonicus]|uniref:Amino-terminal enhancer of split isoform X1 n=1 Tax=Lates japonicus TaxID=270547 RepID=A0AAD3MVF7_LATJO|nr:amino-terminal enhancer of split isoform X1 [Lates japonicus]